MALFDMVENRLVGMKSRRGLRNTGRNDSLYCTSVLELLTLDRITLHYKEQIALRYAELVYDGVWYSPLREALEPLSSYQKKCHRYGPHKLYKASCTPAGIKSPYSLYNPSLHFRRGCCL